MQQAVLNIPFLAAIAALFWFWRKDRKLPSQGHDQAGFPLMDTVFRALVAVSFAGLVGGINVPLL